MQLVELLVTKDTEMKSVLKLAEEQAQIQQKMIALEAKVDMRVSVPLPITCFHRFLFHFILFEKDQQIKRLQRRLKDSEEILSRALFQARQKLASIATASKRPVASEELIKYAYRLVISFF